VKAWYGELKDVKIADLNRILKAHGVRLVVKRAKEWGKNVTITAHPVVARKRVVVPVAPVVGTGAAGGG